MSVVESHDPIANDVSSTVLPSTLENFRTNAVEQYTGHKLMDIAVGELACQRSDATVVRISCDYVVMTIGARPVAFDTATLTDQGIEVVKIGDCREAADISHATKTAYDAANALPALPGCEVAATSIPAERPAPAPRHCQTVDLHVARVTCIDLRWQCLRAGRLQRSSHPSLPAARARGCWPHLLVGVGLACLSARVRRRMIRQPRSFSSPIPGLPS